MNPNITVKIVRCQKWPLGQSGNNQIVQIHGAARLEFTFPIHGIPERKEVRVDDWLDDYRTDHRINNYPNTTVNAKNE